MGRTITVINQPEQDALYANPGLYYKFDLDTKSNTAQGTLQFAGGLTRESFTSGQNFYDGAVICFVEPLNRYWLWALMANSTIQRLEIDPTTTPWTISPAAKSAAEPVIDNSGTLTARRAEYLPALRAVVMHVGGEKNLLIYKL